MSEASDDPVDLAAAEARAAEAEARATVAEATIAQLKLLIEKLRRELYGRRSERRTVLIEQLSLELEELAASATEDELRHRVELETRIAPDPARKHPACIDGARARPPEDVGGVSGYGEFLEAWRDPDHDDHRQMRQWAGRSFDPERFDPGKTDKAVRSAVRKARKDYIFRRD